MKNGILNTGIIISSFIILISVFCFFYGSFEMFPTSEQIEKVKIASFVVGLISLIIDIVLLRLRIKK